MRILFVFLCFLALGRFSLAQSTLMPNGEEFTFWDDQTKYNKVFYVSQLHPQASDQNPGTKERPFQTISQAAAVLQPGEKVVIGPGTYRESVRPARGGTSPKKMIAYEGPTFGGAVYIEASQNPNMIDNNIIWKVDGIGISLKDTDEAIVAHNLLAYTDQPLVSQANTTRKLNGRPLSSNNNKILNNIIYSPRDLPVVKDKSNTFNQNVWAGEKAQSLLKSWTNQGWDTNGKYVDLNISSLEDMRGLRVNQEQLLKKVEPVKMINQDYFGQSRPAGQSVIGPFTEQPKGQQVWQIRKGLVN